MTWLDNAGVVPIEQMVGDDGKDTALLKDMAKRAESYLLGMPWCQCIKAEYFGLGVGGIVAVFLFQISRNVSGAQDWVWVIVGDLPSACLPGSTARNRREALDRYIVQMEEWIAAVRRGDPVPNLYAVNAKPSLVNAQDLATRMVFLRREVLEHEPVR